MPVGVPKVPFLLPNPEDEDEDAKWVDLYNVLYRRRYLFLIQELKDEIANTIIGLLIFLSMEDDKSDLLLFINSPGGFVMPGIGIYDIIQTVPPDVHTVGMGSVASMASLILVGGAPNKRTALPHARIMIHQPSATLPDESHLGEIFSETEEILNLRETVTEIYAERTGKPEWVIYEDMDRDTFMSAEEAKAHGIVDRIGFE